MPTRQSYLIAYDVRDERRLRAVANHMTGYGRRLQYSVFICHLTESTVRKLRWELVGLVEPEDSIAIVPLGPDPRIEMLSGEPNDDIDPPDSFEIA